MFKTPFSFDGRIRRKEYGFTMLIYIAIAFFLNFGVAAIASGGGAGSAIGVVYIIYIPLLWFVWAQGAKRCHDVGKSGWWQIIPFYPFVLLFQDGVPMANEYGINPKSDPSDHIIDSIGAE